MNASVGHCSHVTSRSAPLAENCMCVTPDLGITEALATDAVGAIVEGLDMPTKSGAVFVAVVLVKGRNPRFRVLASQLWGSFHCTVDEGSREASCIVATTFHSRLLRMYNFESQPPTRRYVPLGCHRICRTPSKGSSVGTNVAICCPVKFMMTTLNSDAASQTAT